MYNLFLVCPECNIEQSIRKRFGDSGLFLTALGGVFHFNEQQYVNEFVSIIDREQISCIYIVNDTRCTILNNAINKIQPLPNPASATLEDLIEQNKGRIVNTSLKLAKINIIRQAKELMQLEEIRNLVEQEYLIIKGLIYLRNTDTIEVYHINNLFDQPRLSAFSIN